MARPKKSKEGSGAGPGLAWLPVGKRITKPTYNRLLVCATLFRDGPESRIGLHHKTGIPLSRLSEVCGELIRAGLVRESLVVPASGGGQGRPQTLLDIELNGLGVACVRYDRDQIIAAVVNLVGEVRWQRRWKGPFGEGAGRLMRRIGEATRVAVEAGTLSGIQILAVGAADPGTVDIASGRSVRAVNLPGWQDVPVVERLRGITGLPAVIQRGDGWQALGEVAFGAARGAEHALFVTLLEGIGGGIVEDGRLLAGRDGSAGEIGHTRVSENGPPCGCGGRGCLEAHLAPARLAALWRGGLPEQASRPAPGDATPDDGFARMLRAARGGDARAGKVLGEAARFLARGLGNALTLLNPERVILGGRFVEAGDLLLGPLKRALPKYALGESSRGVEVRLAELGEASTFLGIAAHVRDRVFASPSVGAGIAGPEGTVVGSSSIEEAAS